MESHVTITARFLMCEWESHRSKYIWGLFKWRRNGRLLKMICFSFTSERYVYSIFTCKFGHLLVQDVRRTTTFFFKAGGIDFIYSVDIGVFLLNNLTKGYLIYIFSVELKCFGLRCICVCMEIIFTWIIKSIVAFWIVIESNCDALMIWSIHFYENHENCKYLNHKEALRLHLNHFKSFQKQFNFYVLIYTTFSYKNSMFSFYNNSNQILISCTTKKKKKDFNKTHFTELFCSVVEIYFMLLKLTRASINCLKHLKKEQKRIEKQKK